MAAPEYVPTKPVQSVRSYESPPRRPQGWRADRPGDLSGDGQPWGDLLGTPGPDQGYAYRLVRQFAGKVFTADGEKDDDVVAGVMAVAMKRAALFGRAPVVHDLTVGFAVWGYLNDKPPAELVAARRELFEECANPHHYAELRAVADAVPVETLRRPHGEVVEAHGREWRSLLELPG
jgi:hypothetical protein